MASAEPVAVPAPAKVNLFLGVGPLRADGYHEVVTVLQETDLCDTVRVGPGDGLVVEMDPDLGIPETENIVFRAVERLCECVGVPATFRVSVTKRIPAGAGLGGGSSDAAAALLGACRLLELDAHSPEVHEVAASLGADVPFFLRGGTALYAERGDRLVRLLPSPSLDLVLAAPAAPISTAAAYSAFDRLVSDVPPSPEDMIAALESGAPERVAGALHNDLSGPAAALVPETAVLISRLSDSEGVFGAALSGSGSAVFGICRDALVAGGLATELASEGWWSTATRTRANVL